MISSALLEAKGISPDWPACCRVIVEALCLDLPIVVNKHIVGGWKYVNQYTGKFFSEASDVVDVYRTLRSADQTAELFPREWYKYACSLCELNS